MYVTRLQMQLLANLMRVFLMIPISISVFTCVQLYKYPSFCLYISYECTYIGRCTYLLTYISGRIGKAKEYTSIIVHNTLGPLGCRAFFTSHCIAVLLRCNRGYHGLLCHPPGIASPKRCVIYVYMQTHIHMNPHSFIHTYIQTHAHTHMYIYIYVVCVCVYVYIYIYTHIHE